ncbi:MAG: ribonuclease E/G [Allosphingosinicella sp.]|uniref:Rne/Rng family ribonuclease n=1 Tax=Allosphingosinicella sp. TaxID=2823234 RepID=UPI003942B424
MTMRMLVDARHPEETRVAVVKGNRIEEFDFESAEHKQLKGNIYLAKVTRVEPSLQAAFVDYGGNRHGFLAFSEIHPDYYQIPREDREALLREEMEHAEEEARLRAAELDREDDEEGEGSVVEIDEDPGQERSEDEEGEGEGEAPAPKEAENGSDESAVETLRRKRQNLRRRYKIQDVIKRRQVLLVQVVKEERGNKGAALTTYLSLAGRYCVLMPNTSHGGGISRKISNGADRKRLKQIMADFNLPSTMGIIVRTAGLSRTKTEIKRDFDYLARLWDEIRETTMKSEAPALIYQDSDLIKRAIRDIYSRDIDEIQVEGDEGYRHARAFMKLLMPSHVRRVKQYADPVPLFQRYGVEDQLSGMYQPVVQLKSGGYLVINPTEALVSIDINSGRSTREHNIEQTAYATNLEAAAEIARQLRLRDMAGLVVIDFIDMESNGHIRKVEKAMKEALKNDRARIQVGRISSFGLMEMSRQRLRTGVLEASTKPCPHCDGSGLMRTASSAGLSALRMLEDEAARGRGSIIRLRAGREAAIYLLNKKRSEIGEVEERYGVQIEVLIEEAFEGARMSVESMGPPPTFRPAAVATPMLDEADEVEPEIEEEDEEEEVEAEATPQRRGREQREDREGREDREERGEGGRRRRRRRGRRGGRRQGGEEQREAGAEGEQVEETAAPEAGEAVTAEAVETETAEAPVEAASEEEAKPKRGRRRPRARKSDEAAEAPTETAALAEADAPVAAEAPAAEEAPAEEKPKKRRTGGRRKKADVEAEAAAEAEPVPAPANDEGGVAPTPVAEKLDGHAGGGTAKPESPEAPMLERQTMEGSDEAEMSAPGEPARRGWWQRTFGG